MAQGSSSVGTSAASVGGNCQAVLYPRSPPKAEVDESPLQKSMDRNKESLKVKLMLRRPINQLVAQGIIPQFCHLLCEPIVNILDQFSICFCAKVLF
ncbi:hypothetical protein PGB90_005433 [Kerria lacca]